MAIREGAWDCPSCGRKRNRGPEKFCGGCGAPRGADVKFYLPDDAREVTDGAEIQRAKAGPDWTCAYCGGDNPSGNGFCSGCGASREGTKTRAVTEIRLPEGSAGGEGLPLPAAPLFGQAAPGPAIQGASVGPPGAPQPPRPAAPPPPPAPRRHRRGCLLGGALAAVLLLVLGYCIFRPRPAELTVTGFAWDRSVEVEELKTFTEKAWEGEVPAGARVTSRQRELHHTDHVQVGTHTAVRTVTDQVQAGSRRVKVGTRNLGNGYFEDIYEDRPVYRDVQRQETYQEPVYRDVPVYKTRFTYDIDRWTVIRTEKTQGQSHQARWPEVSTGPRIREGKRTEGYRVTFTNPRGKTYSYEPKDEREWSAFQIGRSYRAMVDLTGRIHSIAPGEGSPGL